MNSRQLTELVRIAEALSRTHFRCRYGGVAFIAGADAAPGSVYRWELSADGFPERNDPKSSQTAPPASGAIAIGGASNGSSSGSGGGGRSSIVGSIPNGGGTAAGSLIGTGSIGTNGRNSLSSSFVSNGVLVVGTPSGKSKVAVAPGGKKHRVIDINEVFGADNDSPASANTNTNSKTAFDPLLVSPTHVKTVKQSQQQPTQQPQLVSGLVPASHLASKSPSPPPPQPQPSQPAPNTSTATAAGINGSAASQSQQPAKTNGTATTNGGGPIAVSSLDDVKKTLFFSEPRDKKKRKPKPDSKNNGAPQPQAAPLPTPAKNGSSDAPHPSVVTSAPAPAPAPSNGGGSSQPIAITPRGQRPAIDSVAQSPDAALAFGSLISINAAPPLEPATAAPPQPQPTAGSQVGANGRRVGFGSDPPEPDRSGFGSLAGARAQDLSHTMKPAPASTAAVVTHAPESAKPLIDLSATPAPASNGAAEPVVTAKPAPESNSAVITPTTTVVAPTPAAVSSGPTTATPTAAPEPTPTPAAPTVARVAPTATTAETKTEPASVAPVPAPAPAPTVDATNTTVPASPIVAAIQSMEQTVQALSLPPPDTTPASPPSPAAAEPATKTQDSEPIAAAAATETAPAPVSSFSAAPTATSMSDADKLSALQRIQEQTAAAIEKIKRQSVSDAPPSNPPAATSEPVPAEPDTATRASTTEAAAPTAAPAPEPEPAATTIPLPLASAFDAPPKAADPAPAPAPVAPSPDRVLSQSTNSLSTPTKPAAVDGATTSPVTPVTPLSASAAEAAVLAAAPATAPTSPAIDRELPLPLVVSGVSAFHAAVSTNTISASDFGRSANSRDQSDRTGFAAAHATSGDDDLSPGASPPDSPHRNVRVSANPTPVKPAAGGASTFGQPARTVTPPPPSKTVPPVSPGLAGLDGASKIKLDIRDHHFSAPPLPPPAAAIPLPAGSVRMRSVTAAADALDRRLGITPSSAAPVTPGAGAGPSSAGVGVSRSQQQRTAAALSSDITLPSSTERGVTFPAPPKAGAHQLRNTTGTTGRASSVQAAIPLDMNAPGMSKRVAAAAKKIAPAAGGNVDSKHSRFASDSGVLRASAATHNRGTGSAVFNSVTSMGSAGSGSSGSSGGGGPPPVTGGSLSESRGVHIRMTITPIIKQSSSILLSRQRSLCAMCGVTRLVVGKVFGSNAHYCYYTGKLYCKECFTGSIAVTATPNVANSAPTDIDGVTTGQSSGSSDGGTHSRVIPSSLLHALDLTRYPVCRLAASYLDAVYTVPSFVISSINAGALYDESPALRFVRILRVQLSHIKPFIFTCRKKEQLMKMFGTRTYMLHDINTSGEVPLQSTTTTTTTTPSANSGGGDTKTASNGGDTMSSSSQALAVNDLYSLRDLLEIVEGDFAQRLHQITRSIIHHITSGACEICSSKASVCELCSDKVPIYPFQLAKTVQCPACRACFHRKCFKTNDPAHCPRCIRFAKRRAAATATAAAPTLSPASPLYFGSSKK